MSIDKAALATRKYVVGHNGGWWIVDTMENISRLTSHDEADAQAACDRLNLAAVLRAIREPEQNIIDAAPRSDLKTVHGAFYVWRAMVDALIAEVKGKTNGRQMPPSSPRPAPTSQRSPRR